MDPIAADSVAAIDMGTVRGFIAALTMLAYLGIFYWAYHRDNRKRFDEDALLPFADEGGLPTKADQEESAR